MFTLFLLHFFILFPFLLLSLLLFDSTLAYTFPVWYICLCIRWWLSESIAAFYIYYLLCNRNLKENRFTWEIMFMEEVVWHCVYNNFSCLSPTKKKTLHIFHSSHLLHYSMFKSTIDCIARFCLTYWQWQPFIIISVIQLYLSLFFLFFYYKFVYVWYIHCVYQWSAAWKVWHTKL